MPTQKDKEDNQSWKFSDIIREGKVTPATFSGPTPFPALFLEGLMSVIESLPHSSDVGAIILTL